MQLSIGEVLKITDAQDRLLGTVRLERTQGDLLCGQFRPGPAFADVAGLFGKFDEAVNAQALAVVDELDAAIAALGLKLHAAGSADGSPIHDVQLYADGAFSCRLQATAAR